MKKFFLLSAVLFSACTSGNNSSSTSTSTSIATSGAGASAVQTGAGLQLNWAASAGYPLGYYVEQSTDGTNFTQVQAVPLNSAVITGLARQKTYYFRVRSYNSSGYSPYSAVASVSL